MRTCGTYAASAWLSQARLHRASAIGLTAWIAAGLSLAACDIVPKPSFKTVEKKPSETAGGTIPVSVSPPTAPTGLAFATKAANQIVLTWTDNATDETAYDLERCGGLACSAFAPVAGLSPLPSGATGATDNSVAGATYYSYRVRAVSLRGTSGWLTLADVVPAATRLFFSTAPSASATASANLGAQPKLSAYDAATHTDTDYATAVTLAAFSDAACLTPAPGTLSGTATTAAGVASFSGVNYSASGTIYLKATSGTLTPACSGAIAVVAATATRLTFTAAPSATATAGLTFTNQPTVAAQDAGGNTNLTYATPITLATYSDATCLTPVAGTLTGSPLTPVAGVSTFAIVSFTKSGPLYLRAASGGLTTACSSLVTVVPSTVAALTFSTAPSATGTAAVNLTTQPRVSATDAYANVVTTYGSLITLGSFSDASCSTPVAGTLNGASMTATSGIATFAGVSFNKTGPLYLRAGDGTRVVCSTLVTIAPGTGTQLVYTTAPSSTNTAGVVLGTQPVLVVRDANSNLATTYATSVSLAMFTDAGCTAAGGGTTSGRVMAPASGTVTYTTLSHSLVGTFYVKATSGALTMACAGPITVENANATTFAVTGFPTPRTADLSATATVTAKDAYGNTVPGYVGTVTFTSSDPLAVLPANYTFLPGDNGVQTFTFNLRSTGSRSITATDTVSGSITGSQTGISVTSGGVATLAVTTLPAANQACEGFAFNVQPRVTAYDSFGNVAAAAAGTISLSAFTVAGCGAGASGGFSASPRALASGIAIFTDAIDTAAETIYLLADDGAGHTICSSAMTVNSNASRTLTVTGGNNQVGSPGASLASPLQATLRDTCAHAISAATVNWSVSQEADGLAPGSTAVPVAERASVAASSTTDVAGIATIVPVLGLTYGAIQVTADSAGATPKTFSAQVGNVTGPGWTTAAAASGPGSRAHGTFHTYGNYAYMWAGARSTPTSPRCTPVASGAIYRWDLVANSWSTVTGTTGAAPTTRCQHASAINPGNGRIYVWGGMIDATNAPGSYPTDGGIYDIVANSWTPITSSGAPAGRGWEMGPQRGGWFDAASGKLLVWGGYNDTGRLADGGVFDGASWSTSFTNAPSNSDGFASAYDSAAGRVYVWSGVDAAGAYVAGGKYLDLAGNAWTTMSVATAPISRKFMSGAFVNGRFVVWAGTANGANDLTTGGSYNPGGDSWAAWDSSGQAGAPLPRSRIPLWNIGSNRVLIAQGSEAGGTRYTDGTIIDFSVPGAPTWTRIPTFLSAAPTAYYMPSQAYSTSLGKLVTFSGDDGTAGNYSSNSGGLFKP